MTVTHFVIENVTRFIGLICRYIITIYTIYLLRLQSCRIALCLISLNQNHCQESTLSACAHNSFYTFCYTNYTFCNNNTCEILYTATSFHLSVCLFANLSFVITLYTAKLEVHSLTTRSRGSIFSSKSNLFFDTL